jgi:prepilin-type N-terminal cleavage/methylation domain-containing protein
VEGQASPPATGRASRVSRLASRPAPRTRSVGPALHSPKGDGGPALHSPKGDGGFTLVELIAVIGILVLLVAVSIPTLSTTQGANVRTAERQVQAAGFLARQTAVTTRQRVVFCVPTQWGLSNAYVRKDMLFRSIVLFGEATGGVARPNSVIGKVEVFPPGVVFTNSFPNWTLWEFVDSSDNVLFRGYGFRYAATGTVYWKDADKTYRLILTEGDVKDAGTVTYRAKPIVSTSLVSSITGRIAPP